MVLGQGYCPHTVEKESPLTEASQSSPPWAGAGSVHVLVFVLTVVDPPPHVTEQRDHSVHCDQIPLTGENTLLCHNVSQYQG